MARISDVLDFWFEDNSPKRWFERDDRLDAAVRKRLLPLHLRAARGELDHWKESAEGCLALCILLDQVPRNAYRGDARAYATDGMARAVTHHALARGFDFALSQVQRLFLYLPLEHSESLHEQEQCVRLMEELDEQPEWRTHAKHHRDIIARFGRFPHRNTVLGRESTAEEHRFMLEPDAVF